MKIQLLLLSINIIIFSIISIIILVNIYDHKLYQIYNKEKANQWDDLLVSIVKILIFLNIIVLCFGISGIACFIND